MLEKMARQGDSQSLAIYESAGKYLGRAISIIANVFNPDKVILGGGVALAGDLLLGPIRQEYDSHTMEAIKSSTEIEVSALGLNAGGLRRSSGGAQQVRVQAGSDKYVVPEKALCPASNASS